MNIFYWTALCIQCYIFTFPAEDQFPTYIYAHSFGFVLVLGVLRCFFKLL